MTDDGRIHSLGGRAYKCACCDGEFRIYVSPTGVVMFEHDEAPCPMMDEADLLKGRTTLLKQAIVAEANARK